MSGIREIQNLAGFTYAVASGINTTNLCLAGANVNGVLVRRWGAFTSAATGQNYLLAGANIVAVNLGTQTILTEDIILPAGVSVDIQNSVVSGTSFAWYRVL